MKSKGKTVDVKCACGQIFEARVADRKRGWARSCSKSCAAKKSNKETGKYKKFLHSQESPGYSPDLPDYEGDGWDAHKDVF